MTLNDLNDPIEIVEDGKTFAQNAAIKALALAEKYQVIALADDSGLMVDYLDGAPGIYSARYAGDHDDEANKQKLLAELAGVASDKRTAHFHCAIVVASPAGAQLAVEGEVNGVILEKQRGQGGFGYDHCSIIRHLSAHLPNCQWKKKIVSVIVGEQSML